MKTIENDVIKKIFRVEDNPEILNYKTFDGIPIWMMARYYFLYNILFSRMLDFYSPTRLRELNTKTFISLLRTIKYNMFHRDLKKNKEIILYTTNRKTIIESRFFNRYTDQLALTFPEKTVTIEQSLLNWEWPFPRVNNCVYFDTISRIVGEIKSRFCSNKDISQITELVEYVSDKAQEECNICFSNEEKQEFILYISKLIISMRHLANWIVKQTTSTTKLFVMVGGAYPFSYPINMMLRKKGIKTADLQHGYITKSNLMYNYAKSISNHPDVIRGLPDYFLTYGDYWNDQFNCPSEKVSLGNPYNDYCMKDVKFTSTNNDSVKKKYVTLFGTGENTDKYITLTSLLQKKVSSLYKVKFRPHPGEKQYVLEYLRNNSIKIEVDTNTEVYDTLNESDVVISEISTVLFEAVGIAKRILVWQTDYSKAYFPDPPFETFSEMNDVVKLISDMSKSNNLDPNYFWSSGWRKNYEYFVRNVIK